MIRAVLFDLDDTLVQFPASDADELFGLGAERLYAYLSAHELPMPAFDPFVSARAGFTYLDYFRY